MEDMVTLKDVACKSGYSAATVSFVLNDAPSAKRIPEETRFRVRRAAKALGYLPNQLARSLRSKRSHTLGVVVFDIADPYCAQILRGIEDALYKTETYVPILVDVQNNRGRFKRYVTTLLERQAEGLIVLGNSVYPERDLLRGLRECRTPIVVIGRQMEEGSLSYVTGDNHVGVSKLMSHLHSLGHRAIAFIRGPNAYVDSGQRWKGIQSFAREAGLTLDPRMIVNLQLSKAGHVGHEGGYELTQRLLRAGRKFTALVAYDDLTAFGAIRALAEAGIKVPRDCSVTGYDDVGISAYYNPPLTTIHQNMELQGAVGIEVLLALLTGSDKGLTPVHRRIAPQLAVRESTAPAR